MGRSFSDLKLASTYLTPFLLTWSSQKQPLQRRQENCPRRLQDWHLRVSASITWK